MKQRIITAIILIILGVAIAAMGIGFHAAYLYKDVYLYHLDCGHWNTFAEVFWEEGIANLIVSVLIGSISSAIGIYMLCKKPWWYKE